MCLELLVAEMKTDCNFTILGAETLEAITMALSHFMIFGRLSSILNPVLMDLGAFSRQTPEYVSILLIAYITYVQQGTELLRCNVNRVNTKILTT